MKLLVRILLNFKDDIYDVFSTEEIVNILKDINTEESYHFIVYKFGVEPNSQVLILHKKNSKLTVEYEDNEVSNLDKFEINSVSEFNLHLDRFLEDDVSSKKFFKNVTLKNKEKEQVKLKNWKKSYQEKLQKEKMRRNKLILIGIAVIPILFYIGNLFYTGEYKFIGQDTSIVKAKVYKTGWLHLGRDFYSQSIYFEYEFDGEKFSDHTYIGKSTGQMYKGDSITIKISNINPKKYVIKSFRN